MNGQMISYQKAYLSFQFEWVKSNEIKKEKNKIAALLLGLVVSLLCKSREYTSEQWVIFTCTVWGQYPDVRLVYPRVATALAAYFSAEGISRPGLDNVWLKRVIFVAT